MALLTEFSTIHNGIGGVCKPEPQKILSRHGTGTPIACGLSSRTRPSADSPLVCLAAHKLQFHRWTPANVKFLLPLREPGELPIG